MTYSESKRSTANKSINLKIGELFMKAISVNVITSDFVCNDGTKWLNGKVDIVIEVISFINL